MSSCYHFCEVLLRKFLWTKNFRILFIGKDEFASKKSSKGVIGESSDSDLHPRRLAEVRPCEWPHTKFMEEAGILQEFT